MVEDNAVNQKIISLILENAGHQLVLAENGKDALERYREDNEFDLILMDVQMPIMTGIEATRHIRAFEENQTRAISIIGLTAHVLDEHTEECIQAGMNDVLGKPIDRKELFKKLDSILSQPILIK